MDSTGQAGILNDVWKFSNGQRAWVTGSKLVNQNGVYGTGAGLPREIAPALVLWRLVESMQTATFGSSEASAFQTELNPTSAICACTCPSKMTRGAAHGRAHISPLLKQISRP